MPTYAINKRANYDYEILEKLEGGLVLAGYEVKSIKTGHISLKGAFVTITGNQAYLTNANIPAYQVANMHKDYDPNQSRKVLIHKREVKALIGKISQKGLTLVPIRVYSTRGLIKLEFGVGKGKKKIDKRENIKKREEKVKMERILKNKR
ncbi:MAG: SsrA-binding protein SmpB [Candidatus Pacebacteria bacterium]|nr:SsrA-binding protein SmpB [Candidatus Paceibacterota bacterium]